MTLERTLAIIKPDAWPQHGGAIITAATEAGLVPVEVKLVCANQRLIDPKRDLVLAWRDFYAEHEGKHFFKSLVEFMASGAVLAMVLEGEDVIKRWRELMGPTDSRKASFPNTIRGRFGCLDFTDDRARAQRPTWWPENNDYPMWRNAVHGSDSPEAAAREIEFFFGGV